MTRCTEVQLMETGGLVKYIGPVLDGLEDQGAGLVLSRSYPERAWNHPLQSIQVYWPVLGATRWQYPPTLEMLT